MFHWQTYTALAASLCLSSSLVMAEPRHLDMEVDGVIDIRLDSQTVVTGNRLGQSLATGDFNNDGMPDLVIGAPGSSSPRGATRSGAVYFLLGGSALNSLPAESVVPDDSPYDFYLYSNDQDAYLGEMLVVGDVNADNIDDLLIVGQAETPMTTPSRIFIVLGRDSQNGESFPTGANTIDSMVASTIGRAPGTDGSNQDAYYDHICGLAVGDLNNDGVNDIALCDEQQVLFQVVYGAQTWPTEIDLSTDANVLMQGTEDDPLFTTRGISKRQGLLIEDMDGDQIDDLLIGLREGDVPSPVLEDAGMIYMFKGSSDFPATLSLDAADVLIKGALQRDFAGEVLVAGDVNGNGKKDLIIGNPDSSLGIVSATGYGRVQVLYDMVDRGSEIDLFDAADVTMNAGEIARIGFKTGHSIVVKDINGDNFDDLLIGTPNAFILVPPGGTNGWIHVVYGSDSLPKEIALDTAADIFFEAPRPRHPLNGARVSASLVAEDLDNDTQIDMVAGGPDGLGISSGWVGIFNDIVNKQIGSDTPQENPASLDPFNFDLSIPVLPLPDGLGNFFIKMRLADPLTLTFEIVDFLPVSDPDAIASASFDGNTGKLAIPVVTLGDSRYSAELQLTSVSPTLRLQLVGAEEL